MRTTAILLVCCALAGAAAGQGETCVVNAAGDRGTCRSIGRCPKLLPLLRRAQRAGRGSADSDRLLELVRKCPRSAAGRVQICCRNEVTRTVPSPRVVLPTKPDCGQQFIPRVIGGENARIGEFPWMVSIQYIEQLGKPLEHGCGGSLITSRHVLTAAHCVTGLSSPMFPHIEAKAVVLGELNFNTERDCSPERCADPPVTVDIDAIFVHPRFQNILRIALPNDIAVVRLARQVTFSQYIMPVCLLTDVSVLPAGRSDNAPGLRGVVAGWGRSEIGGELRFTPVLQKASVPIQEIRVCQRELKITVPLTKRICAGKGEDNADTCRGDSGGPLIVPVNFGEFWYQTGISSFGSMVCGNVAGYTRVFDFADWIVEQINK